MVKKMIVLLAVVLLGCTTKQTYVEGTATSLGVYLPYEGQLFGAEVVSYINGLKATFASNVSWKVERTHSATNSYFGMVRTIESTNTKIEV